MNNICVPHHTQVRIRVRNICKALEEDSFRPVLHHYDGPKFRLELSVPEVRRIEGILLFHLEKNYCDMDFLIFVSLSDGL